MPAQPLQLDRRAVLRAALFGAAGLAGTSLLAACGGAEPAAGAGLQARVEDTQAGTAGAVIRPISEQNGLVGDLDLTYVAGTGPGDVQNKLLSGALNVASMGPLGAVVAGEAGSDLVIFSTSLLAGSVVVETVFTRPGLGRLTVSSVGVQDIPVVQGVVLFAALVYVVVNLVVDLVYPLLDPRIANGVPA
ncbi:ABC transporter permease subunit [Pseudonocardia sp. NPDC046786]|uniref:ABC transporter permease subunit n=1 Tax=Pseudonocardia sp. NPDC046786 TaxID=3155471 RepID=UPI0033E4D024